VLRDAVVVTWAADLSDAELERFWAEHGGHLLRAAVLLTGGREAGEDLLQAAMERVLPHWFAIEGDPEPHVRRAVYRLAAHGWRGRAGLHGRRERVRRANGGIGPGGDVELVKLLPGLPPRQRAVIVLLYWEELAESEAADVLGCSAGTVRSAAAHGLRRLQRSYGTRVSP
jgi:DNA-directed RNA polymerase specialized sigma24 family protein